MRRPFHVLAHYVTTFAALAIMLNSAGWLLFLTALLWVPAFALHGYAILRGARVHPNQARALFASTAGLLLFALLRYDDGDAGGYTGLSGLLADRFARDRVCRRLGSAAVVLPVSAVSIALDLKIIRAVNALRR